MDAKKVGLALGTHSDGCTTLEQVELETSTKRPAEIVEEWVRQRDTSVLLALDAPLGWPTPLANALINHCAGDEIEAEANDLFRRTTDRFIRQHIGRQPLDVGADRIARTAHAALSLLGDLRQRLDNAEIPLAWKPDITKTAVIEVYPAATLTAHGVEFRGYRENRDTREDILQAIGERMGLSGDLGTHGGFEAMQNKADALDAATCVLAAHDFLTDQTFQPPMQIWLVAKAGYGYGVLTPNPLVG